MTSGYLNVPYTFPAYQAPGVPAVGATLYFYNTGTSVLADIFSDPELTIPILNPQVSDINGMFTSQATLFFANSALAYDAVLNLPNGSSHTFSQLPTISLPQDVSGYLQNPSVVLTGTPTTTTPAANDSSSRIASTQFVQTALSSFVVLNAAVIPQKVSGCVGLTTSTSTQNSSWSVSSATLVSTTSGNNPINISSFSGTLYLTGSIGANGLDAGGLTANTFYWIWLISTGTTTSLLASTSNTSPTMPSGYTYLALIGVLRTDGSNNTIPFMFANGQFDYIVTPMTQIASGSTGSTWTQISVSSYVPTGAVRVRGSMHCNNNTINAAAAPINMGSISASNGSLNWILNGSNGGADYSNTPFDFPLVTQSVWWWSNGSPNSLFITGFSIGTLAN